jgi:phospholipase C
VGAVGLNPVQDLGFGMMPNGLAFSPDGGKLYAACGGANAVAVIELKGKPEVKGYVPSGWYPVAVAADGSGLVVACSKGIGARPANKTGRFGVHDGVGLVQFVSPAAMEDLASLTNKVAVNNRWEAEPKARPGMAPVPVPERIGEPSVFKHVVYIIKENLTYDNVLGDMPEGNGDPGLCIFGASVTPNHHRLAKQFVLLDNTYTSGTNSADGHQWTSSAVCNGYQEQNYRANQRSYPYDGGDPLACSPKGFLWTAVHRKGLSVRVYGEYVNNPKIVDRATGKTPGFFEFWEDYAKKGNKYKVTAETDNAALRPFLHPNYIGFPSIVPDQWRADRFLEEFRKFEKNDSLPSLCMLLLPNNHTSGTSAAFPTPRAMVADNDLALGRIVDAVSRSKYWKDTLILVIEDDSQNGLDHVDGHRTAAFCISAYTRRGAVVSEPYNHTSVIRTIELVLGVPSMTRFDQSGTPLRECFQSTPNLAPYYCAPNIIPLDQRNPSKATLRGDALRVAVLCDKQDWSNYDRQDPLVVSKAAWYSQRPGLPFPMAQFKAIVDVDD